MDSGFNMLKLFQKSQQSGTQDLNIHGTLKGEECGISNQAELAAMPDVKQLEFRHFEADDMGDFIKQMDKFSRWYWEKRDGCDRTAEWFAHAIKDEYKEFTLGYENRG